MAAAAVLHVPPAPAAAALPRARARRAPLRRQRRWRTGIPGGGYGTGSYKTGQGHGGGRTERGDIRYAPVGHEEWMFSDERLHGTKRGPFGRGGTREDRDQLETQEGQKFIRVKMKWFSDEEELQLEQRRERSAEIRARTTLQRLKMMESQVALKKARWMRKQQNNLISLVRRKFVDLEARRRGNERFFGDLINRAARAQGLPAPRPQERRPQSTYMEGFDTPSDAAVDPQELERRLSGASRQYRMHGMSQTQAAAVRGRFGPGDRDSQGLPSATKLFADWEQAKGRAAGFQGRVTKEKRYHPPNWVREQPADSGAAAA